jgi:hypothetical protein
MAGNQGYAAATHKAKGSWQLIQALRRATRVDRSEIAIGGLRPEDNEVGSGGSLHKGMSTW